MRIPVLSAAVLALMLGACSEGASSSEAGDRQATAGNKTATRTPDVIFVPTPITVVDKMLEMAKVQKGDVLYDLGSGDGRIPINAALKHGVRSVGIDIDPERIEESRANAKKAGVENLTTFRQEDLFETDISEATVVTMYLLNSLNARLKPKLLTELKPGTRIVSHAFDMPNWTPERTEYIEGSTVYLWTVPEPGEPVE